MACLTSCSIQYASSVPPPRWFGNPPARSTSRFKGLIHLLVQVHSRRVHHGIPVMTGEFMRMIQQLGGRKSGAGTTLKNPRLYYCSEKNYILWQSICTTSSQALISFTWRQLMRQPLCSVIQFCFNAHPACTSARVLLEAFSGKLPSSTGPSGPQRYRIPSQIL